MPARRSAACHALVYARLYGFPLNVKTRTGCLPNCRRKTDTAEDLSLRIATARQELKRAPEFDYVVVNPDNHLDGTVNTVMAIIDAEHHRVQPRGVLWDRVRRTPAQGQFVIS